LLTELVRPRVGVRHFRRTIALDGLQRGSNSRL
jgi:hypothetical protein